MADDTPDTPEGTEGTEGTDEEIYHFQEFHIPLRMMPGIWNYIDHGIIPGDFLSGVICNNLRKAVERADDENMRNIPAYAAYFYNRAPADCWGSTEKMAAWKEKKAQEREQAYQDQETEQGEEPKPV